MNIDDFIKVYCSGDITEIPGTKSNYGNTEYIILGKIIENITKATYAEALQNRILKPLQMNSTGVLKSNDIVMGLTASYTMNETDNTIATDEPYYIENYFSAGAIYSTVEDLLKFDTAIFDNQLLNEETTKLMISPNLELQNVAFGFWFSKGYGNFKEDFVYRPGAILGATANWIHSIDNKKSIIVFSNTNATNLYEMSEQFYLASKGEQLTIPEPKKNKEPKALSIESTKGTWVIDLRPSPKSEPYLKEFVITPILGKNFNGTFYGASFESGIFNIEWDVLIFAFTTQDRENTYYHSGYIDGDQVFGISYSKGRQFTSHWTGKRK
ncbi:serine hydrolase domain-containing protein [Lacinutrix jangbogonensis]|uniref:serine hydrolase domain-containing protein n=1 Tax=Lacinutrix jangbogonensis TaxID=1469557 RepID=UPI000689D866|nr:serine hydrolase domain-containing protein [Lacinutrix jangbogonensis]